MYTIMLTKVNGVIEMESEFSNVRQKIQTTVSNIFLLMEKKDVKLVIIYRWVLFSLVTGGLTFLVSNKVGFSNDFNKLLPVHDQSIKLFITIISSIVSLFIPVVVISLFALLLKVINVVFISIYNYKISLKQAFIISTFSYTFLFLSQLCRLIVSLIKGKFISKSVLSLSFYIPSLEKSHFPLNLFGNIDIFSIIFVFSLAKGLQSYTESKLKKSIIIMFSLYIVYMIIQSLVLH
ncbi:hypothetical protein EP10_000004 [Geobacillus icigianus]|uniref:Yip1 domain-containing protein n=2 Tax=Geobacillus icigianus TaxID=1430331 RepID=A0ABU6BB34_9BACL|nr:hypothetical protein [Geobacillus icigianus]